MDFDEEEYFNEVYCHNVDICGLIMTYNNIFLKNGLYKKTITFPKEEKENFFFILRHIFYKYLFSDEYACKKINIDELIEELKKLSKAFGTNIIINSPPGVHALPKISKTKKKKIIKLKVVKDYSIRNSLPVNTYSYSTSSTKKNNKKNNKKKNKKNNKKK
jgi:hypothetical protein